MFELFVPDLEASGMTTVIQGILRNRRGRTASRSWKVCRRSDRSAHGVISQVEGWKET